MNGGKYYSLIVKNTDAVVPLFEEEPPELQILGVSQFYTIIIKKILGVNTCLSESRCNVSYAIDIQDAIESINAGMGDVAVFLNPTLLSKVKELSGKWIRLPQKANFSYPKLLSDLIFNKFR